ncbi:MAG: thrombospondin type 3 repeat-containing protein, partial [Halobacteriales archaeon]|nr:thrombospondin type 3 repeat-containing protein [Halobacteriales archaeon]
SDTDGDGATDGQEVAAKTDPKDTNSKPEGTSGTTSGGPSGTTSGNPSSSGTSGSGTSEGAGGEPDSGDAGDRLQEGFKGGAFGVGYLLLATGGALVVIVLALVGRGGRWGL